VTSRQAFFYSKQADKLQADERPVTNRQAVFSKLAAGRLGFGKERTSRANAHVFLPLVNLPAKDPP